MKLWISIQNIGRSSLWRFPLLCSIDNNHESRPCPPHHLPDTNLFCGESMKNRTGYDIWVYTAIRETQDTSLSHRLPDTNFFWCDMWQQTNFSQKAWHDMTSWYQHRWDFFPLSFGWKHRDEPVKKSQIINSTIIAFWFCLQEQENVADDASSVANLLLQRYL